MSRKAKIKLREVMKEAWRNRRRSAAHLECKVSEVVFSDCLKMAWQLVKESAKKINIAKLLGFKKNMPNDIKRKIVGDALKQWHPDFFHGATERILRYATAVTRELLMLRKQYA
jgi:hypothetical protein